MEIFIILILTVFIASMIQGVAGFGQALFSMAVLPLFLPITTVTPLVLLNGFIITSTIFFRYRHHFDIKKLLPLVLGAIPGVPLGAWALLTLDDCIIKKVLAVILFLFSASSLVVVFPRKDLPSPWGYLFGFFAGIFGAAINSNGPMVVIYTSIQKWEKDEILATLQSFFMLSAVIIGAVHAFHGLYNRTVLTYWVVLIPTIITGVLIGSRINRRINPETFRKIMYVILLALSVVLFIN